MHRKAEYQKYLKSDEWGKIRHEVLSIAGKRCVLCYSNKNLVVHHLKYPKVFGEESIDDLQCLCEDCHNIKCHNGSPSNHKKKLSKTENKLKRRSVRLAKFAGPVKIFNKEEIKEFEKEYFINP